MTIWNNQGQCEVIGEFCGEGSWIEEASCRISDDLAGFAQWVLDTLPTVLPGYDCYDAITNGANITNVSFCALDVVPAVGSLDELPGLVRAIDNVPGAADETLAGTDEAAAEVDEGLSALDDLQCPTSFAASTPVLMADGSRRPIAEVEVGDQVHAVQPETGRAGSRVVVEVMPHADEMVVLDTSAGSITTTHDHLFWNATDGQWQQTAELDQGDRLLTSDGNGVLVEGVDWSTVRVGLAYDLDIADIDTYLVGVGGENVVVHNCNPPWINVNELPAAERVALDDTVRHIDAGTVPDGPTGIKWGEPHQNREGWLPPGGSYTEYRVAPSPGTAGAGRLRVVVDGNTGAMYYTWTHYGQAGSPPFVRIR